MFSKALLLKSKKLPNKIGVYLFLNDKKVLYVGKSKKLKHVLILILSLI